MFWYVWYLSEKMKWEKIIKTGDPEVTFIKNGGKANFKLIRDRKFCQKERSICEWKKSGSEEDAEGNGWNESKDSICIVREHHYLSRIFTLPFQLVPREKRKGRKYIVFRRKSNVKWVRKLGHFSFAFLIPQLIFISSFISTLFH